MRTADGLIFRRRLVLRFAKDHHAGGLDVQTRSARLDLGGQNGTCRCRFECIDDILSFFHRNGSVDDAHAGISEDSLDLLQGIQEERKHQYFSRILGSILHDFFESLHLGRGIEVIFVSPGNAPYIHKGAHQYVIFICPLVLRCHVAPFLDVRQLRKFGKHVISSSAVIDRRDLSLEIIGIRGHADGFCILCHFVLEVIHKSHHFFNTIFQRRTGHEQYPVCVITKPQHILASLGSNILDVVCFVHNDHVDGEIFRNGETVLQTFEIRDSHAAVFYPCGKCTVPLGVVHVIGFQVTFRFHFTAPVHDNTGRTDNEEMGDLRFFLLFRRNRGRSLCRVSNWSRGGHGNRICFGLHLRGRRSSLGCCHRSGWSSHGSGIIRHAVTEGYHGGESLDGFSKTHLISQENTLLAEDILHTPDLVATKSAFQAGKVNRSFLDAFTDLIT